MYGGFHGVPALLLLICVSETVATVENIEIRQAPRNQTVLISQNATFYCHGIADGVSWVIENNGRHLDSLPLSEQRERGIIQGGIYVSDTEYNNSLTVLGTEENNQTMIHCVFIITNGPRNDTPTVTLTVWGPPAPPQPTMELLNATTLQLTWNPPFTWTGFPIQNHTVRMENTSNNNNRQWNIPANENNSNDSVSFELSALNGEIARGCALLNFNVTAWSDLGESRPGRISGGFPIVPQIDSTQVMTVHTAFQRDGSPLINIRFPAPYVCPFQIANYMILIEGVGTNETINIGPVQYSYQPHFMIEIWVNSSLELDSEYLITATFSSLAGNVSLPNVTVCTDFRPPTTVTPHPLDTQPTLLIPIIVGAAVGALAVLILVILIIIFIMCAMLCCFRKRAKPAATLTTYQGTPPTPMSLNPLYEGSGTDESLEHYENLDPYLVDELQVMGPVLCRPGPPIVPPPRNGTDVNAWLPSGKSLEQISAGNEQYTVMTSAGTIVNMQTDEGPITCANDAERYVINDPK